MSVSFSEVLQLLGRIPLLPCLVPVDTSSSSSSGADSQTLLSWISAQDRRSSLEQMVQQCQAARKQVGDLEMTLKRFRIFLCLTFDHCLSVCLSVCFYAQQQLLL